MTTVLIYFRRLGCLIVFLTYAGSSTVYAAPTFFLSSGSADTGDVAWQAAVGAFTEFDLEGFACSSIQLNLTDGSTTITIGPGATGQEILCSPSAFAAAGGVFGTVEDRSLFNQDSNGVLTANLTFAFSQPVAGFGLWIFDDVAATPDSFTMTVTESGGATTTSGVLDAAAGALGHQVEGFIGATSSVGIRISPIRSE